MTNQIHVEIRADELNRVADEAWLNYESKMRFAHIEHCDKVRHYNKNRNWVDIFLFSEMHEMTYKEYLHWYSDKKFLEFLEQLRNLIRSKSFTGEKIKLSVDLDKWDMLIKEYGRFQ